MNLFAAIPFFRILIPFVAGILAAFVLDYPAVSLLPCALLLGVLVVCALIKIPKKALLFVCDVFLFVYALALVSNCSVAQDALFYGRRSSCDSLQNYVAVINDVPVEKEKTIKCELKVLELKRAGTYQSAKGTVIAYFKKPVVSEDLKAGTRLMIRARLMELPPPLNPYEFNYRVYLERKQVFHTAFVEPGCFATLPVGSALNPLWQAGLNCKQAVMQRLKNGGLSSTACGICCALLTGYDDDIDRSVMDAFSHSGTLHVLSVSGLHTGLIYLVLGFLFDLFDRRKKYKTLKFILITLILWSFALLTGFSAPVLRAVIMFNLFGLGNIYFRNDARNQLNILLVSAFILLCYNPFFISDVGFLLSYFALAGLICFQPGLYALWQPGHVLTDYAWKSVTASAAATISTLPITLFYFKQFPVWFFLCNLVVVPATFLLLLLAFLLVIKIMPAAFLINHITSWLVAFIELFNSRGFGFIDNIHFERMDVLFLSLLILLVPAALQYRRYQFVAMALVVLIFWQIFSLFTSFQAKQSRLFTVYQLRHNSLLCVKNKTTVQYSANDPTAFNFHLKPHFISFNYSDTLVSPFNYISTGSQHILVLNKTSCWPTSAEEGVTTLVLANNFKLTAGDLQRFKKLKTIVADGSNNSYAIKKAEELSRNFGIDFYTTTRQGAYLITL